MREEKDQTNDTGFVRQVDKPQVIETGLKSQLED